MLPSPARVVACIAVTFTLALAAAQPSAGQVAPKASWIWFDAGNPLKEAPTETIYFRKTFEENYELQEADIHITCDNAFVLFINGKEVGRGNDWKDGRVFQVKDHLVRGKNVIAVRATNEGGPAGLVAWLVRLTKPGNHYTVLTDGTWKCSKEAPEGWREMNFDDSKWSSPKLLSEFVRPDRWAGVMWNGKADTSRFTVKEGFTIDQVAEPELTGSIVNMTFDWKGRPVISRERGPIFILEDENGDGKFDKAIEYTDTVKNCQGILCYDRETYYLIGDGPQGAALYRLKDTDADDKADSVEMLHKFKGGMGEHGPHAIVAGPDGYLYLNAGNHAWVTATPEPGSPVEPFFDLGHLQKDSTARTRRAPQPQDQADAELDKDVEVAGTKVRLRDLLLGYEADLLPKYEDANGHAVGIKVPGGTIWRLDPDAKHFTLEAAGFRNQYDFAFNSLGEMFTFDSDMEWDEFLPWYRPVAVFHSPPGADHGWRSGSNVGAEYNIDNLPWTVATGRGSPCGVTFYNHTVFPEKYHDALFITDWSYGRIFAIHLKRNGATFKGEAQEFVTGKPLNVTDIEVAPDGSLFFTTGGRNTEGGLYRIAPSETNKNKAINDMTPVAYALDQPQPLSAWGRESIRQLKQAAGKDWATDLFDVVANENARREHRLRAVTYLMQFESGANPKLIDKMSQSSDEEVRAWAASLMVASGGTDISLLTKQLEDESPIVQRRALEALIRTQTSVPLDKLKPLLASSDRFVRYTARLALQRIDPALWREQVLGDKDPRIVLAGLVALNRTGRVAADLETAKEVFLTLCVKLQQKRPALSDADRLDALRCLELTWINADPNARPDELRFVREDLVRRFPTGQRALDYELARLMAAMQSPGAIDKLLKEIEKIGSTDSLDQRADAIHYARCLMGVTDGWKGEERHRWLQWFDVSRDWKGGHSYAGYVANFVRDAVSGLSDEETLQIVQNAAMFPRAATTIVQRVSDKVDGAFVPALAALLEIDAPPVPREATIAALGATGRAQAEAVLLRLYEERPADRDVVVRALANFQNTRNWSIFVRALDSQNKDTIRAAVKALTGIDQRPDGPAAYRAAIQASARLGDQTSWDGVVLLRQWSGKHFGHKKNEWKAELEKWQAWYAASYPDAESATLAETKKPEHNWTYDQLLAYLEDDGRSGSVAAGRQVFEKAVCSKCHKLEQVGQSIGPDLTTLASRFKRKDILEALIYPSRVLSDQYKSYLIATKDGRIITAMKAPDDGDNYVLLLSDASTIKLPKSAVEEMVEGKQSVMPDGLLNQFELREIADLFSFLESGKAAAPTANGQNK